MVKTEDTKDKEEKRLRALKVPEDINSFSELQLSDAQQRFLVVYVENSYNISRSIELCRMPKNSFYSWKANYPHFAKAIELCRDRMIDTLEDAFKDLVALRNPQAVIFGLKTLGKDKGYVERQEVAHKGLTAVNITFDDGGIFGNGKTD